MTSDLTDREKDNLADNYMTALDKKDVPTLTRMWGYAWLWEDVWWLLWEVQRRYQRGDAWGILPGEKGYGRYGKDEDEEDAEEDEED